jgi:NADPH2:quinone reductase
MKAVICRKFGELDDLTVEDVAAPALGAKQVRVAIRAAGVGFMDALMVRGLYQIKPEMPYIPGAVGAGVVMEIGPDARTVKIGERVSFLNYWGAFAEEIATDEQTLVKIPDDMDFAQGATFRLSYSPAYLALKLRANLKPGEVLLVTGASGGVGHAAVQLGKLLGARVIGSVGSDRKMEVVRRFGADHVINHATENLAARVKALTDGRGADVILDVVGGDVFDQCMRCINLLGRIIVMGFTSGRIPTIPANLVLLKNCSILGVYLGGWISRDAEGAARLNRELAELAAQGRLRTHISRRFRLEEAVAAMKTLLGRDTVGKIVLDIGA